MFASLTSETGAGRLRPMLLCLAMTLAGPAAGQDATLSDQAEISLITVLPGEAVYSLFGHSAVRVKDPVHGIDLSYSYGTFDFGDNLFVAKFALGRLDYFLSVAYWRSALKLYRDVEHRPAVEQTLDLRPEERDQLFAFLKTNALEENRYYRYDFLFDNCSTRIRDALTAALGPKVEFRGPARSTASFRDLLRPYLADTPFLRLGIDLLLGARVDRIAEPIETTFLPDHLLTSFDRAVLVDAVGNERLLVSSTDSLITIDGYSRQHGTPDWASVVFWLISGLVLIRTISDARSGRPPGMLDAVLFGVVGFVGVFLLFMWFGTAHHVTASNWNLAWAWPTHLAYAVLLARKGPTRHLVAYATLTAVASVLLIALWSVVPQDLNETFLAVVVMVTARAAWTAILYKRVRAGMETVQPALE